MFHDSSDPDYAGFCRVGTPCPPRASELLSSCEVAVLVGTANLPNTPPYARL